MGVLRRSAIMLVMAVVASSCQSGSGAVGRIDCIIAYREAPGERFVVREVTVRVGQAPDDEFVQAGRVTVRVVAAEEFGAPGSLVVAVLDSHEEELARGHYQFGDDIRDQFRGQHGFTGLVTWRDAATGSEVQYYCRRG